MFEKEVLVKQSEAHVLVTFLFGLFLLFLVFDWSSSGRSSG
jgi:hypothetical protein